MNGSKGVIMRTATLSPKRQLLIVGLGLSAKEKKKVSRTNLRAWARRRRRATLDGEGGCEALRGGCRSCRHQPRRWCH